MRLFWYRRVLIVLVFLAMVYGIYLGADLVNEENIEQKVNSTMVDSEKVIPGGMTIGIYMKTKGILVLDTDCVKSLDGTSQEPAKNLVKEGDYIVGINGKPVEGKSDLIAILDKLESNKVVLTIRRNDEEIHVKFPCVKVSENEYKLGIWVRDSVQGIGTVTYITDENQFGALGHGIHDADTESLLEITNGAVYKTKIIGIQKGQKGNPGGLEGIIVYNRNNVMGKITDNEESGIFGKFNDTDKFSLMHKPIEVAKKKEIKAGKASIYCAIDGVIKEYDIEIKSVDYFSRDQNKGLIVEVIDEELLKKTGGIVQGMSGSPIIQDEKLIGAVTHVLVNDPTRGYGIFIENMLDAAG